MAEKIENKKVGLKENLLSIRTLLGFAVAAIVIYIFLKNFDLSTALKSLSKAKWPYFILSILVFYISLPLRGGRWGVLLKPAGHKIGYYPLSHYYFLSWFANAVLPARIGDIYRAYLLKKNKEVPLSLSFGVLFSERVFDLAIAAILVVFSGTYFWSLISGTSEANYLTYGLIVIGLIILVFAATIFAMPQIIKLVPEKWKGKLVSFKTGLFKSPSLFPLIVLMTLAIWMTEALRLYFVFLAFDINAGFLVAIFISQASLILMSIPLSPAGLGLVELLMLKILTTVKISPDIAGAITISDRLISYWSLLLIGGICYLLSSRVR